MNRAIAALTLAMLLSVASPASAQISVQDTTHRVTFRDLQFDLPDGDWQRVTQSNATATTIQFEKTEPLHRQVLSVDSVVADVSHTPDELSSLVFEATEQYWEKQGGLKAAQTGTRTIAGVSYPVLKAKLVDDRAGLVEDAITLIVFPQDFASRGRNYFVTWEDDHSASVDARTPDSLDQVVASFSIRPLGDVLYADDFSDSDASQMPKESLHPERYTYDYVDGEYQIQKLETDDNNYMTAGTGQVYSHTLVTVDAHLADDEATQNIVLECRSSGAGENWTGYHLAVSPVDGTFSISRRDPGRWETLVPTRPSDAIARGTASNHLEFTCASDRIGVAINGTPVALVHDSHYVDGKVLLGVGSDQVPADGRFANLRITQQ